MAEVNNQTTVYIAGIDGCTGVFLLLAPMVSFSSGFFLFSVMVKDKLVS